MKVLVHIQLLGCFHIIQASVTKFSSDGDPIVGQEHKMKCTLSSFIPNAVYIYKTDTASTDGENYLIICEETKCITSGNNGYVGTVDGTVITITILSLTIQENNKHWTCSHSGSKLSFVLHVYSVPSSITIQGSSQLCDLGLTNCEFTCTTDECAFPSPTFTWLYIFDNGTRVVIPNTRTNRDHSNNCAVYDDTLTFTRYETYTDNTPKTVSVQCYITFVGLSSRKITSAVSEDVIFAVKVSAVRIFDGSIELIESTLNVNDEEEKLLKCIAGNGNPTPTVKWFLEEKLISKESEFRFTPNNTYHDQRIYCVADNIPNNGVDDAVSYKPVLYVKVKIQFAYIEPAAGYYISVIENTPEPAVCKTSAGRPRSTIKWFRQNTGLNTELDEGNSTDVEFTDNRLEVTKSTRYVKILRSDSGWILACSASNFERSSTIWANNSKRFDVLYPPEHMSLLFEGKPVLGPDVDVIKGSSRTLKCSATSKPPANEYSWNIKNINGDTLTINDSIQNGKIINCTARNSMESTSGIKINGYGSISKRINVLYGALIDRIEVNGNTGSTWDFKEMDPILIACYVDSNPDSTISLFQGDYLLKEKEQSAPLIYNILSAQCSHTSKYTCEASNGIHNVEQPAVKTVQINVECSPRLAVGTDTSVEAQEKQSAILSLTILAYPIPTDYDWQRNTSNRWEDLINSTSIQMTNASLQFNLTITNVNPGDYGEYRLIVYNAEGEPFDFIVVLKAQGEPEPHTYKTDDGASAGIIGGVVGGLLVCLIVIVVCILRRRNSLDDIKTKLFGRRSSASQEEIQSQETGYSYATVQKPMGGIALKIIDNTSTGAPEATNEGPCYENPTVLTESHAKTKPQKKGKPAKQKDKKPVPQSNDGLQYVELSFSDTKNKDKKTKPAQPKADERTVYDAVQFGVVGAAYTSSGKDENNSKTKMG